MLKKMFFTILLIFFAKPFFLEAQKLHIWVQEVNKVSYHWEFDLIKDLRKSKHQKSIGFDHAYYNFFGMKANDYIVYLTRDETDNKVFYGNIILFQLLDLDVDWTLNYKNSFLFSYSYNNQLQYMNDVKKEIFNWIEYYGLEKTE